MKSIITAGLSEMEADEMRQAFAHAAHLRRRMREVLQQKIDASNKAVRSKDAYGIANWAYLQADAVGYERAMQEVMSLFTADFEGAQKAPEERSASNNIPRKRGRPRKIVENV